ncbi:MAG: hypothetical protein ACYDBH_23470 [Acidobacteriaceae bacterium]
MNERLALWRDAFYEGTDRIQRMIRPTPVISPVSCDFITVTNEVIFREDSFDPVTRIRRGRLYIDGRSVHQSDRVYVNDLNTYNWGNLHPERSYDPWKPDTNSQHVNGHTVQIGADGFETKWRIVGVEKISIGHILLTLRANSLLGVIPELADAIADKDGNHVGAKSVQAALDSLVNAFHRQQATPTVDVARETAKVILTAWIGQDAQRGDLGDVIKKIPNSKCLTNWAASIVNRLHPRGKSAEQERQAAEGVALRPVAWEDAEVSVHLVGMLLREIGWAQP